MGDSRHICYTSEGVAIHYLSFTCHLYQNICKHTSIVSILVDNKYIYCIISKIYNYIYKSSYIKQLYISLFYSNYMNILIT